MLILSKNNCCPANISSTPALSQRKPSSQARKTTGLSAPSPRPMHHSHPAELRHHFRRTPHIEYGTDGCYIGVIPQEGALSLLPDSPEWFAWVASRSPFCFVGQHGCFLASRNLRRGKYTCEQVARRCCKISGLVTEADHHQWSAADPVPYVQTVLEAFGEDRVMFGGDWPVLLLASSYQRWYETLNKLLGDLPPIARRKFWGENAGRIYRFASISR